MSRHWLLEVAAGKLFANAFSEKGSLAVGSLVFNTRLLPDGTGYRLHGEKFYSTGTLFSDYLTVATTSDHDSVASVIVPSDREGVRLIDDWDGFGQRRTGTGTTTFADVAVAADELLADTPYDAEPGPPFSTPRCRLYIHAVVAGVLQSVVDDGAALLRSRTRSFSHALTENPVDDPLYQKLLGELASTAYVARAAVLDAASAIGAATDSTTTADPGRRSGDRGAAEGRQGQGPSRRRRSRTATRLRARRRQRVAGSATSTGTGATCGPLRCTTPSSTRHA